MRLAPDDARARFVDADHGVLGTTHATRGVHLVPVVFAVEGQLLAIPIDRVKPKTTTDLQRVDNIDADPRATLLVEQWDRDDWSRLWWVRADMRATTVDHDAAAHLTALLVEKHPQYRDTEFARLLTFEVLAYTGWAATS